MLLPPRLLEVLLRCRVKLAAATGAAFAREIFAGAFAGDFGLWVRSAGDAFRYRREVGAEGVRLLFNINAEFAAPLAPRPLVLSQQRQRVTRLPQQG